MNVHVLRDEFVSSDNQLVSMWLWKFTFFAIDGIKKRTTNTVKRERDSPFRGLSPEFFDGLIEGVIERFKDFLIGFEFEFFRQLLVSKAREVQGCRLSQSTLFGGFPKLAKHFFGMVALFQTISSGGSNGRPAPCTFAYSTRRSFISLRFSR